MRSRNFIDGMWIDGVNQRLLPVINPATGEEIGQIPRSDGGDAHNAVEAAERAFRRGWGRTNGNFRAKFLRDIAAQIRIEADNLATLETLDNGKPIVEARYDIADAARCFDYYAELAEALDTHGTQSLALPDHRFQASVEHMPAGVVALIVPWNFPLVTAAWKVAPALAAGCTVVLKPSELASLTSLELARIARDVQLPDGVLNVVTGYGAEVGAALASHPGVAKLSFTGSVSTGRAVMSARAQNVADLALELGGKSPMIVFDDVNIETVTEWIMMGSMYNQGQICSATSRVLVENSVYSDVVDLLSERVRRLRVGDGRIEATQMGPLINVEQRDRVHAMVTRGIGEGAILVTGGGLPENLQDGAFYSPTVIECLDETNLLWNEEIFGPVVCVRPFSTEAEAVSLSNESKYGLASAVFSKDDVRTERIAKELEAGIVWVNCSQPAFVEAPWGGVKQSGFRRGLGVWGLHEFLELKQITRYTVPDTWGHYGYSRE